MHVLLEGSVHPPSNKDLLTLVCAIMASGAMNTGKIRSHPSKS